MADELTYEQQIEAGKAIVKGMLQKLAHDLKQPPINDFAFMVVGQDFDRQEESIFDPNAKTVVMKVTQSDLADAPGTPQVRRKLENQLSAAVKTYYKK